MAVAAVLARTGSLAAVSLTAALRVATSAHARADDARDARPGDGGRPAAGGALRRDGRALSIRTDDGTIRRDEPLPDTVRFTSLPARALVRFTATGAADNATVVLGAGASSARIVVNQRGRVRLG